MKRPLFSIFSRPSTGSTTPSTFGEKRAQQMQKRLDTSIKERRTLARAEAATVDPLQSTIRDRGELVSARIGRLQHELSDEQNQT